MLCMGWLASKVSRYLSILCLWLKSPTVSHHRHRIDKYLDILLANRPISDGEATDRCQMGAPQDGGLPELIVARSCLTNHSEAASL